MELEDGDRQSLHRQARPHRCRRGQRPRLPEQFEPRDLSRHGARAGEAQRPGAGKWLAFALARCHHIVALRADACPVAGGFAAEQPVRCRRPSSSSATIATRWRGRASAGAARLDGGRALDLPCAACRPRAARCTSRVQALLGGCPSGEYTISTAGNARCGRKARRLRVASRRGGDQVGDPAPLPHPPGRARRHRSGRRDGRVLRRAPGRPALRILAHLSDLHFGRLDRAVLPALTRAIRAARPDVVVVSGDLTQRARRREFAAARRLPRRACRRPRSSCRAITTCRSMTCSRAGCGRWRAIDAISATDLEPFYADDEIAILGINTARSYAIKDGRINRQQVARSCARLERCGEGVTRIVVIHHPFDLPQSDGRRGLVGRADMAMAGFARCGST